MNPLMKNSFKLPKEKRSVSLQGCLLPISGPFFWLRVGHYAKTFQGIGKRGAWSSLHYSALSQRVLREHYHIFWRWSNFYYLTMDVRRDGKPFGALSLALWLHRLSNEYSIVEWLGLSITQECWNSIFSLFFMLESFPVSSVFLVHFSSLFSQKQQIKVFPFYHYHNPLMKYPSYYLENSCITLYLLSYEYVCANYLMFLCVCSTP